jgi:hypothetical protein
MTISTRTRPAGSPAYYLARPAALWLAALEPRPAAGPSCAAKRATDGRTTPPPDHTPSPR